MLPINLTGKRAFVAGVGDDQGYGWAIARALFCAGATVCIGVWPQVWKVFHGSLDGRYNLALDDGHHGELEFERVYPFDAMYDRPEDVPSAVADHKRYVDHRNYTVFGCATQMQADFGERPLDIVVHSLANGPEVQRPLLDTSRSGYLSAVGASAYSFVSMVQHFGPLVRPDGSFLSLSYLASLRTVPGYGGGMSSAKAALESDTRTLAYEAGRRWGVRVNVISAGPLASRAARAIGGIDRMIDHCRASAPLQTPLTAQQVANAAAFLSSRLASAITGSTIFVDNGFHTMGATLGEARAETAPA